MNLCFRTSSSYRENPYFALIASLPGAHERVCCEKVPSEVRWVQALRSPLSLGEDSWLKQTFVVACQEQSSQRGGLVQAK